MAEGDKGTEDIVGRLEALRKRVPEEKAVKPREDVGGPPDKRKKIYRYVGIAIVVLIIVGMMFLAYRYVYAPAQVSKDAEEALKIQEQTAFIQAKSQKMAEIQDAYAGLPSEYRAGEPLLLEQVSAATSLGGINAVDISVPATAAWRTYLQERVDEISITSTYKLEMQTEAETYKGYDEIKTRINRLSYQELKNAVIQELQTEFIPIRLPRLQAGGAPDVGNIVNVYYKTITDKKTGSNITLIAKDARVVAVIRTKSSGSDISLSESEGQRDYGGGVEGFGTTGSLSTQAASASLSGVFEGSAGTKGRTTSTTYSVKIEELQKAAAASKLPESYITEVLENYGIKLNKIEREANIGDLDTEYLMLLEVSEDEALAVVQKIADENERLGKDRTKMNIFITISRPPSWTE